MLTLITFFINKEDSVIRLNISTFVIYAEAVKDLI